jgi:hypothetical protein
MGQKTPFSEPRLLSVRYLQKSGRGGIRTHGNLSATAVFKTASINHSDTLPCGTGESLPSGHRRKQTESDVGSWCSLLLRSVARNATATNCPYTVKNRCVSRRASMRRSTSRGCCRNKSWPGRSIQRPIFAAAAACSDDHSAAPLLFGRPWSRHRGHGFRTGEN